jgi:hypothetical protein
MATVFQTFLPEEAVFMSTAFPQFVRFLGTNYPVTGLAFDGGSADEDSFFKFIATNYGSGNLTLKVYWYADTASSGNVVWGARIAAITSNTDTQDVETKAFATAQTAQDTHLGTTGQRLHDIDITISNLDSLASGDMVWLHVYRDASDTVNDTMTGDAIIVGLRLSYSDT